MSDLGSLSPPCTVVHSLQNSYPSVQSRAIEKYRELHVKWHYLLMHPAGRGVGDIYTHYTGWYHRETLVENRTN